MDSRTYNFSVVVERDEDGYFVQCLELQGCHSVGDTYEEAIRNIKEAINLYLESLIASNEEIPQQEEAVSFSSVAVAV
jgi:predicted RNase H-like HicB family nuclease